MPRAGMLRGYDHWLANLTVLTFTHGGESEIKRVAGIAIVLR